MSLHDDITLSLARNFLERDDHIFLVHDVEQALELAKHFGFSVALVNLDLQGAGGLSLMQSLRKACAEVPMIVISGALGTE